MLHQLTAYTWLLVDSILTKWIHESLQCLVHWCLLFKSFYTDVKQSYLCVKFKWLFPGLQRKRRGSLWHCMSKLILFGNCFCPPVQCSSHKRCNRLFSSIKALGRNSHHFVEYLISLNHSLSEHMGFPGYHLQGNTKPQKNIFNLKHARGSDYTFQITQI